MGQHVRGHSNIRVANKVASGVNIKIFFGFSSHSFVNENSPTFCFLLVSHFACLKFHLLTSMIWLSVSCLICPSSVCSFSFSLILRWSSSLSSELLVELSPDVSALDRLQQKRSIKMQLDQQQFYPEKWKSQTLDKSMERAACWWFTSADYPLYGNWNKKSVRWLHFFYCLRITLSSKWSSIDKIFMFIKPNRPTNQVLQV